MIKGQKIEFGGKTPYQRWIESQGIPIIRTFYLEDLRKVEVAPWDWKGGRGAILNLIAGKYGQRFALHSWLDLRKGKNLRISCTQRRYKRRGGN